MALTQGNYRDYDFNRMVVRFTMKNDQAEIACAISTDAMDQLEGSSRTPPAQREQQFLQAARAHRGPRGAEIQRCRTGGQSSRRDPARHRLSIAAEIAANAARRGTRQFYHHAGGQTLPRAASPVQVSS